MFWLLVSAVRTKMWNKGVVRNIRADWSADLWRKLTRSTAIRRYCHHTLGCSSILHFLSETCFVSFCVAVRSSVCHCFRMLNLDKLMHAQKHTLKLKEQPKMHHLTLSTVLQWIFSVIYCYLYFILSGWHFDKWLLSALARVRILLC